MTRGRPRQYDPDVALAQAMEVFWDYGYAATSLDQLGDAMEMNRPSVYAAFGDKHELFIKALRLYRKAGEAELRRALDPDHALRESIRGVFSSMLSTYLSGTEAARGCFMFAIAAAEAVHDPIIRVMVAQTVSNFDAIFEARFKLAHKRGEIAGSADPAALARLATGLAHTLSVRARAGESPKALRMVTNIFLAAMLPELI